MILDWVLQRVFIVLTTLEATDAGGSLGNQGHLILSLF